MEKHSAIERIDIIDAPGRPLMSLAVAYESHATTCHTAVDRSADASGQAEQILLAIDDHLVKSGSHRSRLLVAQVWLRNMADLDAVRLVWDNWLEPETSPNCSFVGAALARPEILVEIKVTAAR